MARIKRAVNAAKKRRKVFKLSKGYYGAKSKQYRSASQQVMKSMAYAYVGRKLKKREYRQLCPEHWTLRRGNPQTLLKAFWREKIPAP